MMIRAADELIPRRVSGGAKPRFQPADVRIQDLLDAGERLFLEKGIAATTIDEVAAKAGVAKGTFYLYFKSKDELLGALQDRFERNFRIRIEKVISEQDQDDLPACLDAWVEGAINGYLESVELHDVLFHGTAHHPEKHESPGRGEVIDSFADLIAKGNKRGVWKVENPEVAAVFLFHAMHGVVDHAMADGKINKKSLIKITQTLFRQTVNFKGR